MKRLIIQIVAIGLAVAAVYFIRKFFGDWAYTKRVENLNFMVKASFAVVVGVAGLFVGLFMYYRDSKAKQKAAKDAIPDQP
ncbi:hypothetical protein WEU32_12100 [Brevundimonas sp. BH3]|uniref:hypothetical protein n=1 Tax=Brevundimonas sp. BH3 TaxID=3133089 RepID=UPI0032546DD6